jgi:hypothetical protein
MSFGTPATPEQIKHFKSAAAGLSGRTAGDAIVKSILDFYKAEITVLDPRNFFDHESHNLSEQTQAETPARCRCTLTRPNRLV